MILFSCKNKSTAIGDGMVNYPDMELILKENLLPYETVNYVFKETIVENGKSTEQTLRGNAINWNEIWQPFLDVNIHQLKFDKQYKMDVLSDANSSSMTLVFSPLKRDLPTTNMSLVAQMGDNTIKSIYAEYNDVGFFSSKSYKLLFASGKTIQIQETSKKPFAKLKQKITTLSFLN
jgi:hypothetical protein